MQQTLICWALGAVLAALLVTAVAPRVEEEFRQLNITLAQVTEALTPK